MSGQQPAGQGLLGLVLGGGAAFGAAHAGVLQVLEEAGISCPVVTGTSAGALVGAGYAAGLSSSEVTAAVLAATWADFAQLRPGRRLGLLDTSPLEQTIENHITVTLIEELDRRFAALAWDLKAREPVLLSEGPLRSVLRASSAVPGLFPPVRIGNRLLVDGTFADNLPVWAARTLGASLVIAVSLDQDPENTTSAGRRLLETIRKHHPHPAAADSRPPEILIQPDTLGVPRWSRKGVPELIAAGRRAAEAALPSITQALATAPDHPASSAGPRLNGVSAP